MEWMERDFRIFLISFLTSWLLFGFGIILVFFIVKRSNENQLRDAAQLEEEIIEFKDEILRSFTQRINRPKKHFDQIVQKSLQQKQSVRSLASVKKNIQALNDTLDTLLQRMDEFQAYVELSYVILVQKNIDQMKADMEVYNQFKKQIKDTVDVYIGKLNDY